jgi:hypothetical protein
MDPHRQQIALGVHHLVPFAARYLLATVEAAITACLSGLDALGVDAAGTRLRITARQHPCPAYEQVIAVLDGMVPGPFIKVVPHRAPFGKVMRQVAPLAAHPHFVSQ